jgi:hydroxymethylglutaryl-CoA reductase
MVPLRVSNATRLLAETQDEYFALAIVDEKDANGFNMMTSVWEPSPAELKQLNEGGAVRLTILGEIHPPVMMATQAAPE